MSKITNDDLTKYPHGNNGRQKVNLLNFNLEIKEFSIGNTVQRWMLLGMSSRVFPVLLLGAGNTMTYV